MKQVAPQTIGSMVEIFLKERRQGGFNMEKAGIYLPDFARFAARTHHRGPITSALAVDWVQSTRKQSARTFAHRLTALQPFLKFWNQRDSRNELVPTGFFGRSPLHIRPHIYTTGEIRDLVDAAFRSSPGAQRAAAYATALGLLAATGMRVSEALNLRRKDVDLSQEIITITDTKFKKSRYIALHSSVTKALERYGKLRDEDSANGHSEYFFAISGRPLGVGVLQNAFVRICKRLRWRSRGDHSRPRIHDLRHTFICRRIESWYSQGFDVQHLMLSLSTYVGHAKPSSTYWYLTATPRLMALAARRSRRSGLAI
jgi:integrase